MPPPSWSHRPALRWTASVDTIGWIAASRMRRIRSSRRRRTLVAACVPYLLLSLFVDFVHLHPLLSGGTMTQIAAPRHVGKCTTEASKTHESPCAICQWLRAGTGLKAIVAAGPAIVRLPDALVVAAVGPRGSPALVSIDPRGPPSPQFA
jgi:hypothetical protein